jgi:hypothetical protein
LSSHPRIEGVLKKALTPSQRTSGTAQLGSVCETSTGAEGMISVHPAGGSTALATCGFNSVTPVKKVDRSTPEITTDSIEVIALIEENFI